MTESLRSQLTAVESMLRQSEERMAGFGGLRDSLRDLVGHAEAEDGKIVTEWSATEGLVRLDLDPRAMRMASVDLADAIRGAVRDAVADLSRQTRAAIAEAGVSPGATPTPQQLSERLAQAREEFVATGREAADGIDDAQRRMTDGPRR